MISILIPVYNYDCTILIKALCSQCVSLRDSDNDFDYEIILGDDCSTDESCITALSEIAKLPRCRLLHQDVNIGRAAIRNRLYEISCGDYLLFIDCDAEIVSDDFVKRYYNERQNADVICGALCNPSEKPYGCELRYKYEKEAELAGQRSVSFRTARPYDMLSTFNIMFRREVFGSILFDDRCTEYGYEDVLMGIRLKEEGYSILHTDNALLHRGINSNSSFLKNTEAGIRALYRIGEPLLSHSNLANTALRLKRWHLMGVFIFFFKLFKSIIRSNLLGRHPSLLLFKVYKLGYLCALMDKQEDL